MQCKWGYVLNATQRDADIQRERELTHVGYHVRSILIGVYRNERFCMEEEHFSSYGALAQTKPKKDTKSIP